MRGKHYLQVDKVSMLQVGVYLPPHKEEICTPCGALVRALSTRRAGPDALGQHLKPS